MMKMFDLKQKAKDKKKTNKKPEHKNCDKKKITQFTSTEVIILMIVGILAGSVSTIIVYSCGSKYVKVDSNLQTLITTYNNIVENYYDDVDTNKVIDGAVSGMLKAVDDPYTTYMDSTTYSNFNINLAGSYTGLGVEVSEIDSKLTIAGIFKDSPAADVGLKLGDIIKSIDDKDSTSMSSSDFATYIKESENTTFKIVVERDGKEMSFNIEKKTITLKSVSSKVYTKDDKKIGYIYISIFASNTYSQFASELKSLTDQNIDSLIVDLRDNSGGELAGASNIISLFLNNDKIMYKTETKGKIDDFYSTGTSDATYPIVVLVNGNSASASEVLTASLQENLSATVIGENTYGKGTVQELVNMPNGEQYKITTKKWLTPNGNWINETGIKPDVEVKLSSAYQKNPTEDNDNQLQAAIKYLKEH